MNERWPSASASASRQVWPGTVPGAKPASARAFAGASWFPVEIASDSGMISTRIAAKIWSVARQPTLSIRLTPSGENRNCPNDPAAVPAPNEIERQLSGRSFPNEEMMRLNEQPVSPSPIRTPGGRENSPGGGGGRDMLDPV